MWEIFELLCGKRGVTTADVCKALGIAQSTMSNWKKRRNRINVKHGQKIADYFGVSLQYLMTGMELSQEQALLYGEDADPVTANIKWLKKKDNKIADSNMKNYQSAYKYLDPLHDQVFADINTFDIENCITDMNVPRTIRRYCKMLMHQMYHYAIAHDICNKDYSKLSDYQINNDTEIVRKLFTKLERKSGFRQPSGIRLFVGLLSFLNRSLKSRPFT